MAQVDQSPTRPDNRIRFSHRLSYQQLCDLSRYFGWRTIEQLITPISIVEQRFLCGRRQHLKYLELSQLQIITDNLVVRFLDLTYVPRAHQLEHGHLRLNFDRADQLNGVVVTDAYLPGQVGDHYQVTYTFMDFVLEGENFTSAALIKAGCPLDFELAVPD